jgi:hypothetical protein
MAGLVVVEGVTRSFRGHAAVAGVDLSAGPGVRAGPGAAAAARL